MPDIINSSFQSTTVGQPFSFKKDMDFVMYGRRDETALIIESLLGANYDPAKTYILKGCEMSSDGTTTTITPGYIFGINKAYGNLIARTYAYFHPGSSFLDPVGPAVVVCNTTITYPVGDPITFTDSSTHNVHMVINVAFSAGASGSGDVDFSDLLKLVANWTALPALGAGWIVPGGGGEFPLYKRNAINNDVQLAGIVVSNSTTPAQTFATLPTGYRPPVTIYRTASCYRSGPDTFDQVTLKIESSGDISFYTAGDVPAATSDFISIDGITFSIY